MNRREFLAVVGALPLLPTIGLASEPRASTVATTSTAPVAGGYFVDGRFVPHSAAPSTVLEMLDTPRFRGSTWAILERETTNLLRNPRLADALPGAVGQGGRLPPAWEMYGSGFSVEVVETGWAYVTLKITNGAERASNTATLVGVPNTSVPHPTGVGLLTSISMKVLDASAGFDYANLDVTHVDVNNRWQGRALPRWGWYRNSDLGRSERQRVWTMLAEGEWAKPYLCFNFTQADASVTVKVWEPQVETAPGNHAVTNHCGGYRASSNWRMSVDGDGPYSVLTVGRYNAVWTDGVSAENGTIRIPTAEVSQEVNGVYAFGPLTNEQKNLALDALAPADLWRPGDRLVNGTLHLMEGDTEGYRISADGAPLVELRARRLMTQENRSDAPFMEGGNRSTLQRFELVHTGAASPGRSEVMQGANGCLREYADFDVEYWTSYWLLVEQAPQSDWEIYGQWHPGGEVTAPDSAGVSRGLSPVFSISLSRSRPQNFEVTWRSTVSALPRNEPLPSAGAGSLIENVAVDQTDYIRATWTHFVIRSVFSRAGGGSLSVWRDGRAIVDEQSTALGYNVANGPTFNHGVYTAATRSGYMQRVRYSNVTWGRQSARHLIDEAPART